MVCSSQSSSSQSSSQSSSSQSSSSIYPTSRISADSCSLIDLRAVVQTDI
jgi:hypothetical protein